MTPNRAWRSPRVLALVAFALLLALEFGLRAAGFAALPVTEPHQELGWFTLPSQERPGAHGEQLSINAFGLRDREWPTPEETSARECIAFLGDSRLYALSVSVEQGFARVVEARLRERSPELLTLNFAQPGYGLEQMQRLYTSLARRWKPRTVVVCVGSLSIQPLPPPFERRDFPLRRAILRTALWDFLDQYVLRDARSFDAAWERAGLGEQARLAREGFRVAREAPFEAAAEPFWREACAGLERLRAAVETDGARLVVLVLPRESELADSGSDELLRRWRACVESVAVAERPLVVDSTTALRHATAPFSHADPLHFSAEGHAAVASALLASNAFEALRGSAR